MASILVHIESDGERPSGLSLKALDEGRRIASNLGATLYAHAHLATEHDEVEWAHSLSQWGADRVLLTGAKPDGERASPREDWTDHWLVLGEVCAQLGPTLVLMAETSSARQIAPRLAASLYSDLLSRPHVACRDGHAGGDADSDGGGDDDESGEVYLSWVRPDDGETQRVPVVSLRPRSVVVLDTHGSTQGDGAREPVGDADVASTTRMNLPDDVRERLASNARETDAEDETVRRLHDARIVVSAGAGVATEEGYRLVAELARVLGGEVAATESLHALGLAPQERVVAKGMRHVTPTLYVTCAASGSGKHLGAIARTATIVAINNDPDAPIFRFATYGVVGDIETVLPTLIQGLSSRSAPDRESSG